MSDKMNPISFEQLLKRLLDEYRINNSFLSVPVSRNTDMDYISAIGPAAGPHTQLAGNIVAAYGAGASHFELKTVQIIDGEALGIVKPCIYSSQEVYNTEWSTELTVKQAADEYIKAYILLKILIQELQLGNINGFNFIMSIGYNLAGIQSKKIDEFIENMKNAKETNEWKKDIEYILSHLEMFENVTQDFVESISPAISHTIALSTMHGCKNEEIESIARYCIEKKALNTYVKMNPTLLGNDAIRTILDSMGYTHITFDDEIFETDLDFPNAVKMITVLLEIAKKEGKAFGVKLTNTFQVKINRNELAGENMYLSGTPLYPIAIAVAAKLEAEFDGKLPISYSGGADTSNVEEILKTGIYPVTISSILLKPGGYKNITKMNVQADKHERVKTGTVDVEALNDLAKKAITHLEYCKKVEKSFAISKDYSLLCGKCNNCVDVCPNRANKKIVKDKKTYVIHYDRLCNQCGNCSFFCIAGHKPYLDKLTIFDSMEAFHSSENEGLVMDGKDPIFRIKNDEVKEQVKEKIKCLEEYYEF
ncbi:hypothetical protein [[Clostridium] fimetarium]|uniref:Putative selenate reductase n=1 Tax=[Clostridium] fimetarium TaxID=99656 RepID=A0A1I0RAM3_9FIRM|nr:hypothetical protein [[Clostridium] fimetarium]SEW37759.1 putative selenate reductase [[Clostridium] fimetarium]